MATEYLQFAGALVFFLGLLIGSYWFVYVPNQVRERGTMKVEAGGYGLTGSMR
jgi:hypothetical protein